MRRKSPIYKTKEGFSGSLIPGKQLTIFIVDDDEFFLKLLTKCLSKYSDFSFHEFSNYKDCLASTIKPDIAIIDYYIATENDDKTNGKMVLEKLREKYPEVVGFILSGKAALPSDNENLLNLLDTDFTEMKKKFKEGAYFYFFKNSANCQAIFEILSRISWKSSGE